MRNCLPVFFFCAHKNRKMKQLLLLLVLFPLICLSRTLQNRTEYIAATLDQFNSAFDDASKAAKYLDQRKSTFDLYKAYPTLFNNDYVTDARVNIFGGTNTTRSWLCGDMHNDNFGT